MAGAGSRCQPVTLQRLTRTPDGMGGAAEAWATVATIWCDVKALRASEQERQGAQRTLSIYQFTADARTVAAKALTTSDRLAWAGRTFNVRELRTPKSMVPDVDIIAETNS